MLSGATRYYSNMHEVKTETIYCYNITFAKYIPENIKQLYNICTTAAQRRRRWSNIGQMVYTNVCYLLGYI